VPLDYRYLSNTYEICLGAIWCGYAALPAKFAEATNILRHVTTRATALRRLVSANFDMF
jgi:hypothetical protein